MTAVTDTACVATAAAEDLESLISRARRGDRSALAGLYEHGHARAYAAALKIARNPDLAEDLAHDAFERAVARIDDLVQADSFPSWIATIAARLALDVVRRERRVHVEGEIGRQTDSAADANADAKSAYAGAPPREAEVSEMRRLIDGAALALADRDRKIVALIVEHDLRNVELARSLGITRHHANVAVARTRRRLLGALQAFVLWRGGQPSCKGLRNSLPGTTGGFDARTARHVQRHARRCGSCRSEQARRLDPATLYGFLPPAAGGPSGLAARLGQIGQSASTIVESFGGATAAVAAAGLLAIASFSPATPSATPPPAVRVEEVAQPVATDSTPPAAEAPHTATEALVEVRPTENVFLPGTPAADDASCAPAPGCEARTWLDASEREALCQVYLAIGNEWGISHYCGAEPPPGELSGSNVCHVAAAFGKPWLCLDYIESHPDAIGPSKHESCLAAGTALDAGMLLAWCMSDSQGPLSTAAVCTWHTAVTNAVTVAELCSEVATEALAEPAEACLLALAGDATARIGLYCARSMSQSASPPGSSSTPIQAPVRDPVATAVAPWPALGGAEALEDGRGISPTPPRLEPAGRGNTETSSPTGNTGPDAVAASGTSATAGAQASGPRAGQGSQHTPEAPEASEPERSEPEPQRISEYGPED